MLDRCFNCGEHIDDEIDTYAILVGMGGRINFCESCGKTYNIPNWYNKKMIPFKHSGKIRVRVDLMDYDQNYD